MPRRPSHRPPRPWETGHPPKQWRSKVERESATAVQMEEVGPAIRLKLMKRMAPQYV